MFPKLQEHEWKLPKQVRFEAWVLTPVIGLIGIVFAS
jgi:hypothetical protein